MLEERNVHCTILTPHCRPMSIGPYLKISVPNPRNSNVYCSIRVEPIYVVVVSGRGEDDGFLAVDGLVCSLTQ